MRFIKRSFSLPLLSFLIFLQVITYAQQNIRFSNLSLENGLSQNSVMAITQDHQQFVWFGTKHGLNRYDGYEFKVYKNNPNDPKSISSDEITSILTDHEGVLWVGTVKGLNRYDSKNDAFIQITANPKVKNSISSNAIEHIYQDAQKNLWIGTLRGVNLLSDRKKNEFKTFLFKDVSTNRGINSIYATLSDNNNHIWLATSDGLIRMNIKNGHYHVYRHDQRKKGSLSSNYITSLARDAGQNLWIGTDNGLNLFHPADTSFSVYQHSKNSNSLVHNDIREVMPDRKGMLWIGTQEGLSIFDPGTKKFINYRHDPELKESLSHNSIHSIFQDRNNSIWIGTFYGGVNIVHPFPTVFHAYKNSKLRPSISSNIVSSIVEDQRNNLWIGTEGGGLNYYNRSDHTYTHYKISLNHKQGLSSNLIKTICKDRNGNLLIGTHHGGLNLFNPTTGTFRSVVNVKDDNQTISTAEIIAICEDRARNIWVGSYSGLNLLKMTDGVPSATTVKSPLEKKLQNKRIQFLFEDREQNLWIGTQGGLHVYNPDTKEFRYFLKDKNNRDKLQSDYINCIIQTAAGDLGIGTYFGGLSIYNPRTKKFKTYTEKEGLSNNNVLGIIEDDAHNLWISTDNGLSKLDPRTGKFQIYTKSDGLAGNDFNVRSYFKDSKGELFFGGYNGLTSFYAEQIAVNRNPSPVVFTGLKLFNRPVAVNGPDQLLKEDLISSKRITFAYDQNHFTIGFALLNYIKSDKNRYAYKLSDYDKDWNYTNEPSATYSNLPSGQYTFLVKGVNNDGIAGAAPVKIEIRIKPPIWASWWAYCIYLLIFAVILFLTIRYLVIRAVLKRSVDLQQMKLSFFTNISHEIRTPLTLILGPLENLLKSTQDNMELNRQVIPIKNNADRLMRLITELMDFRKMEAGHMKLNVHEGDIVTFSKEIFLAFSQMALHRNIHYNFECQQESIPLYFDKDQLEKVLFNLLSNAFKFTPDEGKITLSIQEFTDFAEIKVLDNGKGIPYESQNKLFSDFFQVDEHGSSHIGSGIGLALSKSIVSSHYGKIEIQSHPATAEKAGDTCFTVTLKKGKAHFKPAELMEAIAYELPSENHFPAPVRLPSDAVETSTPNTPSETILIVEDNPEIRTLISSLLNNQYQIEESEDGLKGWEKAIETLPDLVICDIMMPVMDGLELCRKLKEDERTSHIPVILLTARSTHIHQVSGMETGADAYITKPFSTALLELNIRNLINSRAAMRRRYGQQVTLQPQNIVIGSTDQAFISRVLKYIEENMADQSFGVPDLASEIGMSQPVLYKKIRAITDLSVNDFIKSIRLKKAAQLLEQNVYTISEISYLIGFNDPKYFSREFRKQYGETPRGFINKLKEDHT